MKPRIRKISLQQAVDFHGHLGPYLVLGLKAGELALKKLNAKKYFGLLVTVTGCDKKPKSCLVDGLQLSTGATFGKGNILKKSRRDITITASLGGSDIRFCLQKAVLEQLERAKTHHDSEALARGLFRVKAARLFTIDTRY